MKDCLCSLFTFLLLLTCCAPFFSPVVVEGKEVISVYTTNGSTVHVNQNFRHGQRIEVPLGKLTNDPTREGVIQINSLLNFNHHVAIGDGAGSENGGNTDDSSGSRNANKISSSGNKSNLVGTSLSAKKEIEEPLPEYCKDKEQVRQTKRLYFLFINKFLSSPFILSDQPLRATGDQASPRRLSERRRGEAPRGHQPSSGLCSFTTTKTLLQAVHRGVSRGVAKFAQLCPLQTGPTYGGPLRAKRVDQLRLKPHQRAVLQPARLLGRPPPRATLPELFESILHRQGVGRGGGDWHRLRGSI